MPMRSSAYRHVSLSLDRASRLCHSCSLPTIVCLTMLSATTLILFSKAERRMWAPPPSIDIENMPPRSPHLCWFRKAYSPFMMSVGRLFVYTLAL